MTPNPLDQAKALATEQGYSFEPDGRITDPGKFEGETVETLYWHVQVQNGDGEAIYGEGDEPEFLGTLLDVEPAEREAFGIAPGFVAVFLTHSDQGFVGLDYVTAEQVATLQGE